MVCASASHFLRHSTDCLPRFRLPPNHIDQWTLRTHQSTSCHSAIHQTTLSFLRSTLPPRTSADTLPTADRTTDFRSPWPRFRHSTHFRRHPFLTADCPCDLPDPSPPQVYTRVPPHPSSTVHFDRHIYEWYI